MKFTAAVVTLSIAGGVLASSNVIEARALPDEGTCGVTAKFRGYHYPQLTYQNAGCVALNNDCMNQIKGDTNIWSKVSCVAAATCESPASINTLARCSFNNPKVAAQASTPALSKDIYKMIVGEDCADVGSPISQQDYIDFVYGALSSIKSDTYPSAEDVINIWWNPIKEWAKTGDDIPYENFNDFLHYFN